MFTIPVNFAAHISPFALSIFLREPPCPLWSFSISLCHPRPPRPPRFNSAPERSPSMPSATIFRLGWTNPQTDAFGAHPQLGPILDLNDGAAFALAFPGGVELPPPPRTILTAGNVRTQGERATRAVYRHNRRVVVRLLAGPMSTYSDLAINIRTLVSWLAAPPA